MEALDIARWQFGITTVYHFLMVPLTIGLGLVVAALQTAWVRTGKEEYLRLTKFWGKLFLINFIMGVATGLVQEFQFGMAWSEYSRFVGDVFGAPLALESLLAFFTESVFLGLWIFGWNRLPKKLHLATIWLATGASALSAYFILAANSWMQHPVGVELVDGRAVMTDIWAVLTNNTLLVAFPHTITGAFAVAGGFLLGISWYHLWKRRRDGIDTVDENGRVIVGEDAAIGRDKTDHAVWLKALRIGAAVAVVAFAGTAITGDLQGKLMFEQQPMKMAAAEAACHNGTSFSVLSVGDVGAQNCDDVKTLIEVPGVLSFLANGDFNTPVDGVNTLIPEYQENYGTHLPDDPMYGEQAGTGDRLPAGYVRDLLGLPHHDRFRRCCGTGCRGGAVGYPQGHRAAVQGPYAPGRVRHPRPVRRQQCRLDLHRNGPPALRGGAQPELHRHRQRLYVHGSGSVPGGEQGGTALLRHLLHGDLPGAAGG